MSAKLVELADGVFAWLHDVQDRFTCNVGVLVEDDDLILIDTSGRPSSYEALKSALERFRRPVGRIVLTHEHGDHVAGVGAFPGAVLMSSRNCAASLERPPATPFLQRLHPQIAGELSGLSHPKPDEVVEGTISLGRQGRIELLRGHTAGDLVVRVPDADVLFAGDLCFFGHVPLGIGADFQTWGASLKALKATAPQRIIPGHGPIGGRADLDIVASYLEAVLEAGRTGAPIPQGPWSDWWDPWSDRIPDAIHRINVEQVQNPGALPPTLVQLFST